MEMKELESLEAKTKQIVGTLSGLESEVKEYQQKNLKIQDAFDGLTSLSGNLTDAASDFVSIIALLRKSDLGEALVTIDQKIEMIKTLSLRLDDSEKRLIGKQDEMGVKISEGMDAITKAIADVQHNLTELDAKISRIDRNTQKGFWKEKG